MLKIDSEYVKGILFVRIKGNLNRHTAAKLNNFLLPAILKHKIKFLVYNLYNLDNIDYIGVRALEKCSKAINANNGLSLICEIPQSLELGLKNLKIERTLNELTAINRVSI